VKKYSSTSNIQYISFEDELIVQSNVTDIASFLDVNSLENKATLIEKTFTRVGKQVNESKAEHIFLDIHLSYFKQSRFVPPFFLAAWNEIVRRIDDPNVQVKVITLVDDAFVIWQNLKKRERDRYPGTSLRLREIISWRSVEMLLAESLAKNLTTESKGVKNYLVAVRHPPEAFFNLIFSPNPVCAYLSFPITKTRDNPDHVKEITQFRECMHNLFINDNAVLFDPVTIDELALRKATNNLKDSDNVVLEENMRWPIKKNSLLPDIDWPIVIRREEVDEVLPDITNNIRERDFKLIDNSIFTIVYKPFLGGPSEGVRAEMDYAMQQGKGVYVLNPDFREQKNHPFSSTSTIFKSIEELSKHIKKVICDNKRRRSQFLG